MNLQNASKKMFGPVMLAVALLLVACGSGDGESTPTATSGANEAVPTLPSGEGTAAVDVTQEISEENLTVVSPEVPANAGTAEAEESTPAEAATTASTPTAEEAGPVDLTGDVGTPTVDPATAATLPAVVTTETVVAQASIPAKTQVAASASTPAAANEVPADIASPPAGTPPEGGTFNNAGDGTGGSGQPGERSSNVPGLAAPSASPVAGPNIEGCEVPNVPAFTGASASFVTIAEVNFRAGPGTECDPILGEPLPEGQAVEVLGGPVTQASDGSVWLQVEVDGVPGWISEEFAEPAG